MHDPVTVLATLFRNFDELANGAAIRPGGKKVNIVFKERSVLYEVMPIRKGLPFVVAGCRICPTRGYSWQHGR